MTTASSANGATTLSRANFSGYVGHVTRDEMVSLAAWHLPGGPVGPPVRWAATSNVERRSGAEVGARGP